MDYASYKQSRQELAALLKQQQEIVTQSGFDEIAGISVKPSETLKVAQQSLDNGDLNTLVMGRFSTGKSVFLNALMGMEILPSDVRPCTAVIGEILHGEHWGVTLYARDTKLKPIKVELHQLKEYATIPHGSESTQNAYSKVEINAPLPVFANGVRFVDSPGLDDPTSHDEVTTTYLPKADAIVYIMSCSNVYSKSDKVMIDELRSLGHTSIIFVMTFFDQLEMNDMMYGTDDAEKCRRYCVEKLAHLTDLGESGIFFVNSRGALKGKVDNNEALLERSHFPGMEMKLEQILASEKGRMKLGKVFADIKAVNEKCATSINSVIQLSGQKHDQLRKNVEDAKLPLAQAENKAKSIYDYVHKSGNKFVADVKKRADLYYTDLINKVSEWISNIACENKISLMSPKVSTTKFVNELLAEVKVRMMQDVRSWGENTLANDVNDFVTYLSRHIDKDINACVEIVDEINTILNINHEDVINSSSASSGERVVAAGVGLLLGDIYGATMGGINGFDGLIRTIACEVAGICVLVIASFFTPIGLSAMIFTAITAAITGAKLTASAMEPKVRKKITEKLREELEKDSTRAEFLSKLQTSIDQMLSTLNTSIEQHVSMPINQARKMLEDAQKIYKGQGEQFKTKAEQFKKLYDKNSKLAHSLLAFEKSYLS